MDTPKMLWARSLWQRNSLARNNHSQIITFLAISFIVFLTRIPFLLPGYGIDPDAWGVAYISWLISHTHQYAVSRFPGFPLQEYAYALIWQGGPLIMNGVTALFSGFAAGFLALSGKKLGYPAAILGALIFAFTPVIYLNSVNSMDYLWAIAFILGSLYFSLSNRIILAGIFLGLAIGTRITSIAIFIPLILVLRYQETLLKDILKFTLISSAVGGLFYIPALSVYGADFLTYHQGSSIPTNRIFENATSGVWGWVGLVAILMSMTMLVWQRIRAGTPLAQISRTAYWKIWLISILIYLLIYSYLPHEAAYLIPLVPLTILFLQEFLTKNMLILICFGVICSSLLIGIYPNWQVHAAGFDQRFKSLATHVRLSGLNFFAVPFYGSMLYDHSSRTDEIERFEKIIAFGNDLQSKSVFIVGWHLPKFAKLGLTLNEDSQKIIYIDFLDFTDLKSYMERGYQIYYLPEILGASIELYHVDFTENGGTAIDID